WEESAAATSSPAVPPAAGPGAAKAGEPQTSQAAAPATTRVATVTGAEALEELPLAGPAAHGLARPTRVTGPRAAAPRAPLEWLTLDASQPRPFGLRVEDSVLEVMCESIRGGGLHAAHEALAAADGNLAPLGDTRPGASPGAWLVRVPAFSPRPLHLMIEQGS